MASDALGKLINDLRALNEGLVNEIDERSVAEFSSKYNVDSTEQADDRVFAYLTRKDGSFGHVQLIESFGPSTEGFHQLTAAFRLVHSLWLLLVCKGGDGQHELAKAQAILALRSADDANTLVPAPQYDPDDWRADLIGLVREKLVDTIAEFVASEEFIAKHAALITATCLAHRPAKGPTKSFRRSASRKGVSLGDAATIMCDGDEKLARDVKKRWHNDRTVSKPDAIGHCPNHRQVKLYEPSALLKYVKEIEGEAKCNQFRLETELQNVARTVVCESQPSV